MLISKSRRFNEEELLDYAASLSSRTGGREERLLHWPFGPVMNMKHDVNAKNYLFSDEAVPLHWDGAFFKEPRLLLFYCTESEGAGGETLFVDTRKVWASLDERTRRVCEGARLRYRTEALAHYGGEFETPLVCRHPVTGETILRLAERVPTELNPVELEIRGVADPEGFYREMVERLYDPRFIVEHAWESGDLVVVDNFAYLHGRKPLGENRKRSFKRIQIL